MCDAKHIVSRLHIDIISQRENPKSFVMRTICNLPCSRICCCFSNLINLSAQFFEQLQFHHPHHSHPAPLFSHSTLSKNQTHCPRMKQHLHPFISQTQITILARFPVSSARPSFQAHKPELHIQYLFFLLSSGVCQIQLKLQAPDQVKIVCLPPNEMSTSHSISLCDSGKLFF